MHEYKLKQQIYGLASQLHLAFMHVITTVTTTNKHHMSSYSISKSGKLTKYSAFQDRLDGTYTRLLMRVQNMSWRGTRPKNRSTETFPQSLLLLLKAESALLPTAFS